MEYKQLKYLSITKKDILKRVYGEAYDESKSHIKRYLKLNKKILLNALYIYFKVSKNKASEYLSAPYDLKFINKLDIKEFKEV